MDIANSLFTSVFGMSVVFAVLVSLILLIYLQSYLIKFFHHEQPAASVAQIALQASTAGTLTTPSPSAASAALPAARPALKLINVDEKTAAMVMAIVCDESGIPFNELVFKSIRLLEE